MHQISLKDILEISENTLFDIQVDGNLIKEITKGLDERIEDYFASITLDQLVEKQINSYSNDYCI
jgi:DNA-binding IscR family transcriptional regulator